MNISFNLALVSDIPMLLGFIGKLYQSEQIPFNLDETRDLLRVLIDNPVYGEVRLIQVDQVGVGYFVLSYGFSLEYKGRDVLLDELYISPNYRGLGIGKKTLSFIEDYSKNQGIKAIHLEVSHDNQAGQNLYERFGFKKKNRNYLTKWI